MIRRPLLSSTSRLEIREAGIETRVAGGPLSIKSVSDSGEFEGHGSVFNVTDSYGDQVMPGAFKATLEDHKAKGTLPAMLWQHDAAQPIGVYSDMAEDATGLYVKGQLLLEAPQGKIAHTLLKAKALRGLSIGFVTREADYDQVTGLRKVKAVDLWEVSLVTFPANPQASVESVKDSGGERGIEAEIERILRDAGKSRSEAKTLMAKLRAQILDRRDASEGIGKAMSAADRLLKSLQG